jgi:hypothetical protein
MLCERCQEREATVYLTLVFGASAEATKHDFCESCHAAAEAERVKAYNSQPNIPLSVSVELISVSEYLEARENAARNGGYIPAFRIIQERLQRLPQTRQRLALEMLPLAWESLERGEEPQWMAGFASFCWDVIKPERLSEYTSWLEKLIVRSFELRNRLPTSPGEHGPFSITLFSMLVALGKVDRTRFTGLVRSLEARGGQAKLDPRWKVIGRAEEAVLSSKKRKM